MGKIDNPLQKDTRHLDRMVSGGFKATAALKGKGKGKGAARESTDGAAEAEGSKPHLDRSMSSFQRSLNVDKKEKKTGPAMKSIEKMAEAQIEAPIEAPPSPPPLPSLPAADEWTKHVEPVSGHPYWENHATGVTRWGDPKE